MNPDNDTISRRDLRDALRQVTKGDPKDSARPLVFTKKYTLTGELVDELFDLVNELFDETKGPKRFDLVNETKKPKREPVKTVTPSDETLTYRELDESLTRLKYGVLRYNVHAEDIYRDVKDHREPAYEVGAYYKSAQGMVYQRVASGWMGIGAYGVISHDIPTRPLTKI